MQLVGAPAGHRPGPDGDDPLAPAQLDRLGHGMQVGAIADDDVDPLQWACLAGPEHYERPGLDPRRIHPNDLIDRRPPLQRSPQSAIGLVVDAHGVGGVEGAAAEK